MSRDRRARKAGEAAVSRRTDRAIRRAARDVSAAASSTDRVASTPSIPEVVNAGQKNVPYRTQVQPDKYALMQPLKAVVLADIPGNARRTPLMSDWFDTDGRVEFKLDNWPVGIEFHIQLWWGEFLVSDEPLPVDSVELVSDEGPVASYNGTVRYALSVSDDD